MGNTTWSNHPRPLQPEQPQIQPQTSLSSTLHDLREESKVCQDWIESTLAWPSFSSSPPPLLPAGSAAAADHPPCRDWDGFGHENTTVTQVVLLQELHLPLPDSFWVFSVGVCLISLVNYSTICVEENALWATSPLGLQPCAEAHWRPNSSSTQWGFRNSCAVPGVAHTGLAALPTVGETMEGDSSMKKGVIVGCSETIRLEKLRHFPRLVKSQRYKSPKTSRGIHVCHKQSSELG